MRTLILAAALILSACASNHIEGLTGADYDVIASIHSKVQDNWLAMPYLDSTKRSATVKILLQPDGTIADLQISKSSGNTNFDNGLLIAIRQATPFQIPKAKHTEPMQYELTFTK